ncbi:MAG: alkaline phosphatase family protein [Desulfurivibrionaceae bacterium]
MIRPDYNYSIVNLVSSLILASGGKPRGYAPLVGLEERELSGRPLVLLVIDGLGDSFLGNFPDSFLFRHRKRRLSSVFPPTTATAVTSFYTGVGPRQHGIIGWYTFFKEMGTVATVLPFRPRYGGPSFSGAGVSPAQFIGSDSLFNSLDIPCHVVLPHYLIDSGYSRTLSGKAQRHSYEDLAGMFARLENLAVSGKAGMVIAYLPDLDSLAHEKGISSPEVKTLFRELDRQCQTFLPEVADSGATVLISADHGLVDSSADRVIHLNDHPRLASTLALPLCGDPRCAYCYVRPERQGDFEHYIDHELGFACELKTGRDLIREGYFGPGPSSPRLEERIGDYALLMRDNYVIKDCLLTEDRASEQKGVHGGLTEEELYVPLILL